VDKNSMLIAVCMAL